MKKICAIVLGGLFFLQPFSVYTMHNQNQMMVPLISKQAVLDMIVAHKISHPGSRDCLNSLEQAINNLHSPQHLLDIKYHGNGPMNNYANTEKIIVPDKHYDAYYKNYYDFNAFAIVGCSLLTGLVVWFCMSRSHDQALATILEKYGNKV